MMYYNHDSMFKLNLKNVEQFVFFDKKIQKQLMEFQPLFQKWLNKKSKSLLLEFLNGLEAEHLLILETYFGDKIEVEKINCNYSDNCEYDLLNYDELITNDFDSVAISRLRNRLYISFWR